MRPYEVMIIFDTDYEGPAIQAVVDKVLELMKSTGGVPGTIDRWGKRPFCYEVKHRHEGYYIIIEFAAESKTVSDLDRMLGLAEEVLRHRVLRRPEGLAPSKGSKKPSLAQSGTKRPRRQSSGPRTQTPDAGPVAVKEAPSQSDPDPVIVGAEPLSQ